MEARSSRNQLYVPSPRKSKPETGGDRSDPRSRPQPVFIGNPAFHHTGYNRLHPLAIGRVGPVTDICRMLGWLDDGNYRESAPATAEDLLEFHHPDYVEALVEVSATGQATHWARQRFCLGTMENPVFPGLFNRVAASVGGSVLAADLAMDGRVAFHPAGGTHHGRPDRASGFCYSNDPVFAVRTLLEGDLTRVAYVDLDAHHGDGVEDAFASEPRVLCISVHEEGRWPGTGLAHTATARNFPVARGFGDTQLADLMAGSILPELGGFSPEAVVITCGADSLAGDPLSAMELTNIALWHAVEAICATAPRAVVLGGGGYNPWTTIRYWTGLWGRLNGFDLPERLPPQAQTLLRRLSCDLVDDDDIDPAWFETLADVTEETVP